MNAPNCSGVLCIGSAPLTASRSLMSGTCRIRAVSAFSEHEVGEVLLQAGNITKHLFELST
jgi:hypothetical protein